MDITSFDELLCAAHTQPEPQRLLFVFAGATLPEDSTPEQRALFEAGEGGELTPVMSVDKTPSSVATFEALVEESRQFGREWSIVFVAGLAGRQGCAPTDDAAGQALEKMVESVKRGMLGAFIPFDRYGQAVRFS